MPTVNWSLPRLGLRPRYVLLIVLAGCATPVPSPTQAAELIVCADRVRDGYDRPLVLDGGVDADRSVRKIIRNCTFRNSDQPGILIRNARNVLIEGSTFENIRTHVAGRDTFGIFVFGSTVADDITIRNNTFRSIGADAIQLADSGRLVTDVVIEHNRFHGSEDVGENAIDVKGADGPILIRYNTWSGFRPCDSPRRGGTQDCSGSPGEGVVIHEGSTSGRAHDVTLVGNTAIDNAYGLVVSHADDVTISGNTLRDSVEVQLLIDDLKGCRLGTNTFEGTATKLMREHDDCVAVTPPRAAMFRSTDVGLTSFPVRVSWSAMAVGTGADLYQLERRADSGSYVRRSLPRRLSTSLVDRQTRSSTHRYRVRLHDDAGHVSPWAYSPGYRMMVRQGAPYVSYSSGWSTVEGSAYISGSVRQARAQGARATVRFSGRGVAIVMPRGPSRGRASIRVDGRWVETIDLRSSSFRAREIVYARNWAAWGTHSVSVTVESASGRSVRLDAFLILAPPG